MPTLVGQIDSTMAASTAIKRHLLSTTRASAAVAVGRPDVKRDYVSHAPLAVHFVRQDRCSKPWSKHDTHRRAGCDETPFQMWRDMVDGKPIE